MLSASVTTESTMHRSIRLSFVNTFVALLLVSSLTSALLTNSDSYVQLKDGLIPVDGGTVTGSFRSSSAVRCAAKCSEMADDCNGFLLQSTSACNSTAVGTGSCQLVSFPDLGSVVLDSVVGCQRFYVKDVCVHDDVNPCKNSAMCDVATWPRVCTCTTGYVGTYCNTPVGDSYFMSVSKSYYVPVFKLMTWGDATRMCKDIDPFAHLAIIRSPDEFQQLQGYLTYINDHMMSEALRCLLTGFWTAQRRLDVYTTVKSVCLSSPFVWVKNNSTTGLLPAESWESIMWPWAFPANCELVNGVPETCVAMTKLGTFNDVLCWMVFCPICQLET